MSEIEVGEYIRTKDGIKKVKQITVEPAVDIGIGIMPEVIAIWVDNKYESAYDEYYTEKDIIKHSKNILDIVEVGDYINGDIVNQITKNYISVGSITIGRKNLKNIRTILTHEQYEQNCYKL